MQALTKVVAATGLALVFVVAGCSESIRKGGRMGAVGGVALGAIGGNAALGMTVGRVAGMGVGYIYDKSQEGSD